MCLHCTSWWMRSKKNYKYQIKDMFIKVSLLLCEPQVFPKSLEIQFSCTEIKTSDFKLTLSKLQQLVKYLFKFQPNLKP